MAFEYINPFSFSNSSKSNGQALDSSPRPNDGGKPPIENREYCDEDLGFALDQAELQKPQPQVKARIRAFEKQQIAAMEKQDGTENGSDLRRSRSTGKARQTPERRRSTGNIFTPPMRRSSTTSLGESPRDGEEDGIPVKVLVRCRPTLHKGEVADFQVQPTTNGKKVNLIVQDEQKDAPALPASGGRKSALLGKPFRFDAVSLSGSSQAEIFQQAKPIVEHCMEGYHGAIFCFGVTGSGKTYTMSGPPDVVNENRAEHDVRATDGIVPRVAQHIFEYISDRGTQGEVFVVEASFLEIYSPDGIKEELLDLLFDDDSDEKQKLEITLSRAAEQEGSFVCEGLRRVPIRSPDEMCSLLRHGQKRVHFLETSRNCLSSRSHCLFQVTIESALEGETTVRQSKLVLVDLAGSESLKRVSAANEAMEDLRQRQAIGINRVLSQLGTVVNNLNQGHSTGYRDSALTMLLKDCLGGNARALMIANVGPEVTMIDETMKTLTFANQMTKVRNVARVNRIAEEVSRVSEMRDRHRECLRILQEKAENRSKSSVKDKDRDKLQQEVEQLNSQMLTREHATKTLTEMREAHRKDIEEMRDQMELEISNLRRHSLESISDFKQVLQDQHGTVRQEQQESIKGMLSEVQDAHAAARKVQEESHQREISELRNKASSLSETNASLESEVRALRAEIAGFEEKSRILQARNDGYADETRASTAETQQLRHEHGLLKHEIGRLQAELEARQREAEEMNRRATTAADHAKKAAEALETERRDKAVMEAAQQERLRQVEMRSEIEAQAAQREVAQLKEQLAAQTVRAEELVRREAALQAELGNSEKLREQEAERHRVSDEQYTKLVEEMREKSEDLYEENQQLTQMITEMQNSIMQAALGEEAQIHD